MICARMVLNELYAVTGKLVRLAQMVILSHEIKKIVNRAPSSNSLASTAGNKNYDNQGQIYAQIELLPV